MQDPKTTATPEPVPRSLPHVVVVGAGFAGLAAAKALAGTSCKVKVIDRRNYHLFQPLLYQVATAALSRLTLLHRFVASSDARKMQQS